MGSSTPDDGAEHTTIWPSRHPREDAQPSDTEASTQAPPLPDYAEPQTEQGEGGTHAS